MAGKVKAIPDGFHSLQAYLTVKGAAQAIEFYKKAFGAKELYRMPGPGGSVMHCEMQVGDSRFMLSDEFPEMGPRRSPQTLKATCFQLFMYVPDVDATFKQAVASGAKAVMPVADMFWGDRYGTLTDPFGHEWGIATHKEDLTPEQVKQRADAFFAKAAAK